MTAEADFSTQAALYLKIKTTVSAIMSKPLVPKGTWDSHVHVIDEERFPFVANPKYRPGKATVEDLSRFTAALGVENIGLVAVSVYGNDNRSIMDGIRRFDGNCKAVVSLDPAAVTDRQLDEMDACGVCGVRINLKSHRKRPSKTELIATLTQYAERIRSKGWFIQVYLDLEQVSLISQAVPHLGVKIVIDHMGEPNAASKGIGQPGYHDLVQLLNKGAVWVKISGSYRFTDLPDLDEYAAALIAAGPKHCVWASDWPHTGGPLIMKDGQEISSFRNVRIDDLIERCFHWCGHDQIVITDLFVHNPRRLWLG